ncbi:scavenger receptor class B member 1-like [Tropilaelaps mercedesae]|uniref:Scavenger receptor class B member 1 n=1 Tax=Tropilaelaps mercedesae TaxID=418985 RepID=A0A1V9XA72_9ACAR|nr:scavenger receptor class B member 1-like [Tropilaelaps mercedesae]
MKSRGITTIGICALFALVAFLSVTAFIKVPALLEQFVLSRSGISRDSLAEYLFSVIPFDIRQNVYMLNITNPDEFFKGAKPHFQQLGPYVFRVNLRKNMTWSDGDLLTYRENRKFWYDAALSNGHLNDSINTVDPVYTAAQEVIDELPLIVQKFVRPLLESRKVLFKHTVRELLYDGYTDPLAELAHLIKPDLPVVNGKIGYLRSMNDTDDGDMTVFGGTNPSTRDKRNLVIEWRHKKTIPYYSGGCNRIWGANAELYPSFNLSSPPEKIGLFLPLFCRPWSLHYNGTRWENGLKLARFGTGLDIFSSSNSTGIKECAQPGSWPQGLFDVRACQHDFPALLSLPHFLHADDKILQDVDGLRPDVTKHDLHLDVFPLLGIPVRPAVRVQLNVRIWRHLDLSRSGNPSIVYPVLWQEIVLSEQSVSYIASMIWYVIQLPQILLQVIAFILFFVSVCFIIIHCYAASQKASGDDTVSIMRSTDDMAAIG